MHWSEVRRKVTRGKNADKRQTTVQCEKISNVYGKKSKIVKGRVNGETVNYR